MNPLPISPVLPISGISDFLVEVEKLFDEISGSWSPILFRDTFRPRIAAAWNQIKFGINTSVAAIKGILANASTAALEMAGLIGEQLQLKLDGLNDAWKRFVKNGTVGFLRKLLAWINSILTSLIAVVAAAEAWKEFKEAIEKLIESPE